MSRHNRRRTRGGHLQKGISTNINSNPHSYNNINTIIYNNSSNGGSSGSMGETTAMYTTLPRLLLPSQQQQQLPPPTSHFQPPLPSPRLPPGLSLPPAWPSSSSSSAFSTSFFLSSSTPLLSSPSSPPLSMKPAAYHLRPISSSRTGISARHWHNRYMAWQAREKRQREESARLQAEKTRIFGWGGVAGVAGAEAEEADGDVVEDEELCEKMLEYFGGLDFIEW